MVGHFLFQQIRFLYSRIAELRGYGSLRGAPDLISEEALESILHIAQQANYHNNDPLIMVSPTPVFGFELAEKLMDIWLIYLALRLLKILLKYFCFYTMAIPVAGQGCR